MFFFQKYVVKFQNFRSWTSLKYKVQSPNALPPRTNKKKKNIKYLFLLFLMILTGMKYVIVLLLFFKRFWKFYLNMNSHSSKRKSHIYMHILCSIKYTTNFVWFYFQLIKKKTHRHFVDHRVIVRGPSAKILCPTATISLENFFINKYNFFFL